MEVISADDGKTIAILITRETAFSETTFVSPPEIPLQLGFVVHGAGGQVPAHCHMPIDRRISITCEFLWVRKGRCEVDLFDDERKLVTTRELRAGDAILLLSGGHGFRMIEDTVLAEVKQGPYIGLAEKERFG
jgi:hypothetical protein